jgi:hypothetical protein
MGYASNAVNARYHQADTVNAATPKAPTVAGALGRIESLNERLAQVSTQLAAISDAIGGPRPTAVDDKGQIAPSGIVYRLNDGADAAHLQLSEIEELIGAIGRALG